MDSDEFFDADNELEGRAWPTNQIAEPPSMSIPVDEEDPEDIEEDPGLMETDDTSGERVRNSWKIILCDHHSYYEGQGYVGLVIILKLLLGCRWLYDTVHTMYGVCTKSNNTHTKMSTVVLKIMIMKRVRTAGIQVQL